MDSVSTHRPGGIAIVTTGRESLQAPVGQGQDADLVARALSGDVEAFGELVQRHERAVCGIVSRMVYSRDDIDDIVQDVFVQAYRSLPSFKGNAAISTWLYRIAVNTTIKHMRKAKLRQAVSIDDPEAGFADRLASPNGDGPEDAVARKLQGEAVRKAIQTLPEKHRAVVVLHYYENLGCDEIAGIVGCSVGTVWSRLHYACKKLHSQLGWLGSES